MTTPVRYPPSAPWPQDLDDIERSFEEQPEPSTEIVRLDDHLDADAVQQRRLRHLDRLVVSRSLTSPPPRAEFDPYLLNWLAMLLWPIAALCAVGFMIGIVG
jgi:hypothetical protein